MSGGVAVLVQAGPLLLAIPVAAAAGAVTFLSPCVLPLVPGYLSYITGMSGSSVAGESSASASSASGIGQPVAAGSTRQAQRPALAQPTRSRALAGTALFVLGFSALFAVYGVAFGGIGSLFQRHARGLTEVLGVVLIVLGLLFAGAFDRFGFAGRIVKPSVRPRAGLASAPLLGVLFGVGWTPCAGPTLSAVLTLGLATGTAARGALLAFVYALGLGIPFMIFAFGIDRGVAMFGFARRHARVIARIGGLLLIVVGVLEVTGAWFSALIWLKTHWVNGFSPPI